MPCEVYGEYTATNNTTTVWVVCTGCTTVTLVMSMSTIVVAEAEAEGAGVVVEVVDVDVEVKCTNTIPEVKCTKHRTTTRQ